MSGVPMISEDLGVEVDSALSFDEQEYNNTSSEYSNTLESSSIHSESSKHYNDHVANTFNSGPSYSIYNYYFYGQIANVIKASVWWSTFGVLITFFTESHHGISLVRLIFNISLILSSPFSTILAERITIKNILLTTTFVRGLIWSLLVPIFWYYLYYINHYKNCFLFNFMLFMFIDGLQVSFSNIVDIDCGGFEGLSLQYNFPLSDTIRHTMNSIHQIVFDLSFAFVSLPIAYIMYYYSIKNPNTEIFLLPIVIPTTFLILSLFSLFFYLFGLPRNPCPEFFNQIKISRLHTVKVILYQRLNDIFDGFLITVQNRILSSRTLFLAIETAFDDCLISLIIPSIALHNNMMGKISMIKSNLIAVLLISFGKLGGVIGTYISQRRRIHVYSVSSSYLKLSKAVFSSMVTIVLLPASAIVIKRYSLKGWICIYIFGFSFFMFFLCNSLPKVWLSTLLHTRISENPMSHKIFSFVGLFITFVDAFVIICMNYLFPLPTTNGYLLTILYYTSGFYIVHGLLQILIGPFTIY